MQQPVNKSVATAIVVAKTLRFFMITVFNVKLWPSARNPRSYHFYLVSFENISGINLVMNVIQTRVIPICYNRLGLLFEFLEVIDDEGAEEGAPVFEGGLVDDDLGAFGLNALHDSLDGGLTEVVRVGLHGEAVDADGGNCGFTHSSPLRVPLP